ncbi:Cell growth defect factor-2 isoform 3, partial [Theobroma cacao]
NNFCSLNRRSGEPATFPGGNHPFGARPDMDGSRRKGYAWAISAGLNAAFAAISAKFFLSPLVRYGLVIIFNVIMWGCYVNSLKALSSLQATVTNFATNFLTSGFAGSFLFEEPLSFRVPCSL